MFYYPALYHNQNSSHQLNYKSRAANLTQILFYSVLLIIALFADRRIVTLEQLDVHHLKNIFK